MCDSLKCHQRYSLSTDSYQYRAQIQIYIDHSLPISVKTKSPIKKIIRLANSILKLNLFECAVLSCLLKKSSTQTNIQQLDFQNLDDIQVLNQTYDKKVLLYLLLNGYHVKNNFLSNGAQVDIDPLILQHVKSFREIYRDWKPERSVKNISIGEINKIFQNWAERKSSAITKPKIDYNKVVDKILILSKTYNVGGGQDGGSVRETNTLRNQNHKREQRLNKKRKLNQIMQKPKFRYCQQKEIVSDNPLQASPMKNSGSNKIPWFQDNNDLINLGRSQRTINRSFYNLRSDDVNQNMLQSFRSQESGMIDSLRNTSNARFFNLNNSYVQLNNQSIGGFGMFKSSLESDVLAVNEPSMRKSRGNKSPMPSLKLKPTVSFDEFK